MTDIYWRTIKQFIDPNLHAEVLKQLERVGMQEEVKLPGFGVAERGSRRIIPHKDKEYNLTMAQVQVIINIANVYPRLCSHRHALRGLRSYYSSVDKDYLRVVLSKIKSLHPKLRSHIITEKWAGYRWVENP